MVSKFLIFSVVDLLLGINIFSPVVLLENFVTNKNIVYVDNRIENIPYLLPSSEASYFPIRDWGVSDVSLSVNSAVIYDSNSGKFLFVLEPDKKLPIASLTKLMTAIIVVENLNLDEVVEVKEAAIEASKKEGGGSKLFAGEKIKASDLLKIMLIESSNDAAYAFGEYFREKHSFDLVEKMNQKASELGMNDTFFTEAAGLDDEKSFSTSRDLVKLVEYSFRYDLIYQILKTPQTEVASIDGGLKHQVLNTNKLLGLLLNIIGGKTGFTELAGGSMVLVTQTPSDSSRLITIVLGSNDRFSDTKKLVEWSEKAYIWK